MNNDIYFLEVPISYFVCPLEYVLKIKFVFPILSKSNCSFMVYHSQKSLGFTTQGCVENSLKPIHFFAHSANFQPNCTKTAGKMESFRQLGSDVLGASYSTQRGRKFKKVRAKKLVKSNIYIEFFFREIAFLAVLNNFPVQKLIFGHF